MRWGATENAGFNAKLQQNQGSEMTHNFGRYWKTRV